MSRPTRKKWRLNARAAIILGAIVGVGLFTLVGLSYLNTTRSTSALLRQAEAQAKADPPRYDLALSFLNEYLETLEPDDPAAFEALRQKSELLMRFARSAGDMDAVVLTCQQALRAQPKDASGQPVVDPNDPGVLEVRRRMVAAYLGMLEGRGGADAPLNSAEAVARAIVDRDQDDTIDEIPADAPRAEVIVRVEDLRQLATVLIVSAIRSASDEVRAEALKTLKTANTAMVALARESAEEALPEAELDDTIEQLIASARDLAILYQFQTPTSNSQVRAELTRQAQAVHDELMSTLRHIEQTIQARDPDASIDRWIATGHLTRYQRLAAMAGDEPAREAREALTERAEREMELALQHQPENPEVLLTAAEYGIAKGDLNRARNHYRELPAESRESLRGRLVQANINLGSNRTDEAIANMRSGLESTGGSDVNLTWQLALVLLEQGKLDEAEPLIRQHRRLSGGDEPTTTHRYLEGLRQLKGNKELDEAIENFKKVTLALDADSSLRAFAQVAMARAYEAKGELDEAAEQYRRATSSRPRWSVPYLNWAEMLQKSGGIPEALEIVEAGLIDQPGDAGLTVTKARLLMMAELGKPPVQRDWERADATLDAAREAAPANANVARMDADLKAVRGDLNGAASVLEQAVRYNPEATELWVSWASVLMRMKQFESALIVLQQAGAPGAAGDSAAIRIATANLLNATGKGQQAVKVLTRDSTGMPEDEQAKIQAELGAQLRQRGQFAEARKAYETWARLAPETPQPYIALIELANILGDRDAAAAASKTLRNLGTNSAITRFARIQELLREADRGDGVTEAERLAEADTLIAELEADPKSLRLAALLRGLYHERRDEVEEAIAAYRKALESGAGQQATARLVILYAKQGRVEELRELRQYLETGDLAAEAGSGTSGFDRLSTAALLAAGRGEEAEKIAAQIVAGNPDSLDARYWLARVQNTAGKPEQAEQTFRELAERSTEPGPWLTLLAFQASIKNLDGARATIERIKSTVKSDNPELLLAQSYRLIGDLPAAETAFEAARAKNPDDPALISALSNFYETTGKIDLAVELLREATRNDPEARWAARPLALLLARMADGWDEGWQLAQLPEGSEDVPVERLTRALVLVRGPETARQDEGIELLEGLIGDLTPKDPIVQNAREMLARVYLNRGDNDKLTALTAANAASGTNPQAIALLGESLLRSGDTAAAGEQLQRLEQSFPNEIVTAKFRAMVLKAEGKPDEAATSLQRAFDAHRTDPDGGRVAGLEFLVMLDGRGSGANQAPPYIPDQLDAAESIAREIAATWPGDAWRLGRILARQDDGRTIEALEACLRTVSAPTAKPEDRREAVSLAVGLAVGPDGSEADRELAERVVQKARDLDPENPDFMILQGFIRHGQQRYQDEVDLYLKARARNPSSPLYLNNLAWCLGQELDRASEGLDVINGLLALLGNESRFDEARVQCLDTRGMLHAKLGNHADAIRDFQKALEKTPENPVYRYHLARAYMLDGQEDKFREHRDLALNAGLTPEKLEPSEREEMQELLDR